MLVIELKVAEEDQLRGLNAQKTYFVGKLDQTGKGGSILIA